MSVLSTTPVVLCKRCHKPLVIAHLSTTDADYSGELLQKLMVAVRENALCDTCKNARLYYIKEGRLLDWEAGRA